MAQSLLWYMNQANLMKRTRIYTTDDFTNPNSFANTHLAWANCVLREIYKLSEKWGYLERQGTLDFVANQQNYAVTAVTGGTADLVVDRITTIRHADNITIEKKDHDWYEKYWTPQYDYMNNIIATSGRPQIWFPYQQQMWFHPIPSAALTAACTVFWAASLKTTLTNSSTDLNANLQIPEEDANIVISGFGWALDASLKRGDRERQFQEWLRQQSLTLSSSNTGAQRVGVSDWVATLMGGIG